MVAAKESKFLSARRRAPLGEPRRVALYCGFQPGGRRSCPTLACRHRCSLSCSQPCARHWRSRSARYRFAWVFPWRRSGLADKPLGDGPFDYPTGEGQNIRVTVLTKALAYPFTLTFLPDGTMLVTQRDGKLRVHAQRQARPESGCRRSGVVLDRHVGTSGRRAWLHGYRAASAVRAEPNALPELHETARRQPHDVRRHARQVDRNRAQRAQGCLRRRTGRQRPDADRVRPRRHALHRDERRRRAGARQPRRQSAARARRRQRAERQSVRRQARLSARDLHARPSQLAGVDAASRSRARSGRARTARMAATSSTSFAPARTTAGRS